MITLDQVKDHLVIELDDDTQNSKLNGLILVAKCAVENYINRNIYADQNELDASNDSTGIVAGEDIKHALKLFITHFHENPSLTSEMTIKHVPGVEYLLDAHRLINI